MPLPQALCRCVRLTAQPQPGCSFVTTVGAALTGRPSPHAPPSGPRPRRPHTASPPPPPPAWASEDRSLGFRAAAGLPAWGPLSWTPAASQGQRRAHLWGLKTSDGPAVPLLCSRPRACPGYPSGGPQHGTRGCQAQDWGALHVVVAWCRRGEACTSGFPPHSRFRSPAGVCRNGPWSFAFQIILLGSRVQVPLRL